MVHDERNALEPVEGDATVNGVRLHYREWPHSDAPTLLLIHAWPSSVLVWGRFARAMQDRFRVIALDLRGHGESEWAQDYSWRTVTGDIEVFLRHRGASRASVVGHGAGGVIALCFAATKPHAVTRVVNVDQMPMPRGVGTARALFPETFDDPDTPASVLAERHWADGIGVDALRTAVRRALRQVDAGWTWRRDPRLADAYLDRVFLPEEDEQWALISQVRCPALLVRGSDSSGPREKFDRAASLMDDGRVVEIERSRHLPHLSNPDGFFAALRPFLLEEG